MKSTIKNSKSERNNYLKDKANINIDWKVIKFQALNNSQNKPQFISSQFYQEQILEFVEYWTSFSPKYIRRERPIAQETAQSHVERIARIFGFYKTLSVSLNFSVIFNAENVKKFFYQVGLLTPLSIFFH